MDISGLDFDSILQAIFAALAAYFGGKKGGHDGSNGK